MKKKSERQKLKDRIDKAFTAMIRQRDKNTCQHCNVYKADNRAMHVAHIIPKSKGLHVRWELDNAMCLCFHCHLQWGHLNPLEFTKWFKTHYRKRYNYLMELKDLPMRYTIDDLEGILQYLENKKREAPAC